MTIAENDLMQNWDSKKKWQMTKKTNKSPTLNRTLSRILEQKDSMPKFIIRYKTSTQYCPPTPEEREKLELALLEADYAALKAGIIKDWGRYLDRSGGYSICEAPSEADVFASLEQWRQKWGPLADFDVREVMTIEEALESARQVVEKRKSATRTINQNL